MKKLPELLAPAGSTEALHAAIEAGADAVYFGGVDFSNRMRAKNFTQDELASAISLCNTYGVKSYITVNTRLRDSELPRVLELTRPLYECGASAFIVADAGVARLMREAYPHAELHASTQMTGVNSLDAAALSSLGFSRMVCPRELSLDELTALISDSPIEVEMFVHGAHCVSVSGQCLMSWAMGGRSGNRGECAQPCRLPYSCPGVTSSHPLSLRDLCLARHIPELISSGVASLKIEGRLKSADYVYGVTRIYRRLLDERRAATDDEIAKLNRIFSRDGFTDGYFAGRHRKMTGMRAEGEVSECDSFTRLTKKVPLSARVQLTPSEPALLTLSDGVFGSSARGDVPQAARQAPLSAESVFKNLSKLGSTPYSLAESDTVFNINGEVFLPASQINELRRLAVAALDDERRERLSRYDAVSADTVLAQANDSPDADGLTSHVRLAEFPIGMTIPEAAWDYFDVVFTGKPDAAQISLRGDRAGLDLDAWCADPDAVTEKLTSFRALGGAYVLCHTLGQITECKRTGLIPVASARLNVTNAYAANVIKRLGAKLVILSPELKAPALRDLTSRIGGTGAVVYGKLPLMTMRRCIYSDSNCSGKCGGAGCLLPATVTDRRGVRFNVLPAGDRVNVVCNSYPIYTADVLQQLGVCRVRHFIFTDEDPEAVRGIIRAYRNKLSPEAAQVGQIKRL